MRGTRSFLSFVLVAGALAAFANALRADDSPVPPRFPSGRPDPAFLRTLPPGVRTDSFGNAWITRGTGRPHRLVLARRDVSAHVVSSITPDGFLRLQRLGTPASLLADQFLVGRRVLVYTRTGILPAVVACPSTHFRRGADLPVPEATVDDLWVDIGAVSEADAHAMGVELLDPVVPAMPREATQYAANLNVYAGPGAGTDVACATVAEMARRAEPSTGSMTFAWVSGGSEGGRGTRRLLATIGAVDSAVVYEPWAIVNGDSAGDAKNAESPPFGFAPADTGHAPSVAWFNSVLPSLPIASHASHGLGSADARACRQAGIPTVIVGVPTQNAGAPAEFVRLGTSFDVFDHIAGSAGARSGTTPFVAPRSVAGTNSGSWETPRPDDRTHVVALGVLTPLLKAYGVSEKEQGVARAVLAALPAGARDAAGMDTRGNLILRLGKGAPDRVFVAHMDEIGYRPQAAGGTLAKLGGFYDWLYEGEFVRNGSDLGAGFGVGPVRANALSTTRPIVADPLGDVNRPRAAAESRFETADVRVMPVAGATGGDLTVFHEVARLGAHRISARAIDDRYGCASLVLAAQQLWSGRKGLPNTVWFVWSVEEETGLKGATWLADSLAKAGALPRRVHAVDTFVSSDSPLEDQRYADQRLGKGAVVRAVDTSHESPIDAVRATLALARRESIPLQYGVTSGGNDGVPFAERGSVNVPLAWPLRYSHSSVEVADLRDLESLARMVVVLSRQPVSDDPATP